MIFAELVYPEHYADLHDGLLACLAARFSRVESGLQGDSYVWVFDGGEKVAIDTFTSMKHQIKSPKPGPHVQQVIEALQHRYTLKVYETPGPEGHEDAPAG